jgi:hypothetical protein
VSLVVATVATESPAPKFELPVHDLSRNAQGQEDFRGRVRFGEQSQKDVARPDGLVPETLRVPNRADENSSSLETEGYAALGLSVSEDQRFARAPPDIVVGEAKS